MPLSWVLLVSTVASRRERTPPRQEFGALPARQDDAALDDGRTAARGQGGARSEGEPLDGGDGRVAELRPWNLGVTTNPN